jgi:uncharacterized sulfatase
MIKVLKSIKIGGNMELNIIINRIIIKISSIVMAFLGLFITGCTKVDKKPNIVFILVDDLGWSQLSSYGSVYYESPNIDRLAQEGIRFTNAYAGAAVCSPTRASIMTGKYPARLHLTDYIPGDNFPGSGIEPDWNKFLPLDEITIGEIAKENGYRTAFFGKWHLSPEKKPPKSLPYNPDKQGFDETFITYKPAHDLAREWQTAEVDPHNVDTLTKRAIDFIERNQSHLFFLFVSYNSVHAPLLEKDSSIKKYKDKDGSNKPENNPVIAAMIERVDRGVGKIIDKIDEMGLRDNTFIIFFSDNGGTPKQTPLRMDKAWLYEGGIRVPFVIRWPKIIEEGRVSDEIVSSVDFFPTFLDIFGDSKTYIKNVDGISLLPVLKNNGGLNREAIFWHYPHYLRGHHRMKPAGAVRKGDYKLIEWYEGIVLNSVKHLELYNLNKDIGEQNDLSEVMPEKTQELLRILEDWRVSVNAQMPNLEKLKKK